MSEHDWPLYANEPDRLILRGSLGSGIIATGDMLVRDAHCDSWIYDTPQELVQRLAAEFDVLTPEDGDEFLENCDFYQGVNTMRVLRRKADGHLFGYRYWDTAGNDNWESNPESNGNQHPGAELPEPDTDAEGFHWDEDWPPASYVFLPVAPFTITGYRFPEAEEGQ